MAIWYEIRETRNRRGGDRKLMNLEEYQTKARSTAIYLDIENSQMIYPALGLVGECGEVAEKVKKLIRDFGWDITQERKDAIVKELGDCCWYLANICCDTDLDLNVMYEMRGSFVVNQICILELPQLVLRMNRNASTIAESLEHWHYKHKCHQSQHYLYDKPLSINISHILACIEEIAKRCDSTLEEVCVTNIEKLARRKKEGTLKGDGDSR